MVISALITVSVLAILIFVPVSALTVRLPREDNRLVQASRVSPGDTLDVSYRHSVERTRVVGRFTIGRDQSLLATETRMTSVGTGLPNCEPDRTHREGEWIVVDEGNEKIPSIRFYFTTVNQTHLTVAGQPLDFDAVRSGNLLLIAVETPRLIQWGRWLVTGKMWPLS
jgi:hypothetical protein